MLPVRIVRAMLPKEAKEMLNMLKGKKTLLGLILINVQPVIEAVANIMSAAGGNSEDFVKVAGGIIALLGYAAKFIPDDKTETVK